MQRYFALCDLCYWAATVLESEFVDKCPVCSDQPQLSKIPLTLDETYSIAINSKGIEMAFDKLK